MTLTKDDLQAIAQIVDERLEVQLEAKLEEKLDAKLDEKLDAKLESRLAPIMQRLDHLDEKTDRLQADMTDVKKHIGCLDEKVDDLQTDMIYVKKHVCHLDHMVKSEVIPRLKAIEGCYVSTYDRYRRYADGMEGIMADVEQLKRVAADHSRRLRRIEAG